MRWEIIDTFEVLKIHRLSRARKYFSGKEDFFAEHFSEKPVVPEPLFIEMIAQTGGVLFGLGIDFKKEIILAKVQKAVFKRLVSPPCEFVIESEIHEEREEGALISGRVTQDGLEVASAKIILMTVEQGHLASSKSIVFNEKFMKHYDVRRVASLSETEAVL